MLIGKNGFKYYFEIFTVLEDAKNTNFRDIAEEIRLKLLKLYLPYDINLKIKENFNRSHVSDFLVFIQESLQMNTGNQYTYKFYKECNEVAEFRYIKSKSAIGSVNAVGPSNFINAHGRVKNRILDKINEQIPLNNNNILIINLSYVMPLFFVIEEALKLIEYPENILLIIAYVGNDYKNNKKLYPNPILDKNSLSEILSDIC